MMIVTPGGTELTASGQAFAMMQHHAGGEPSALLYAGSRAAPFTRFDLQPVAPERKDDAWQVVMPPHSMLLVKIRPEQ